ncbi:MAG: acetylxylan esterase [Proteobacteria bacterium]|nr:acetylxylan esterase [Pseudomonadota bacterium]
MPAMFDMPMERLLDYQGSNPRPADFAEFWAAGLAELDALDPTVDRKPATFRVPFASCEDLYFTGVGGARVHAKLLRPTAQRRPGPAVLMFHAYAQSAGDWTEKLAYASMGFTVAALDCRGQGGTSQDVGGVAGNTLRGHIVRGLGGDPRRLLYRQIYLDTALLARIVMQLDSVDDRRVATLGRSQGGALALACAALEPRVARIASIMPFLSDYRRVWDIDLARDGYAQLHEYFRLYDPLHEREEELFTQLGYIDVQHLCSRIRGRVQMTIGLMDTICPPSTQFAAYNKITAEKALLLYPDFAHETPPGHSDRVFQFLAELSRPGEWTAD